MISVCLATYNGEKFIKKQIESILHQLCSDDEIIISDDGSVDNTIRIVNGFNDKRIKIVFNKLERGYTNNFENAINHASGNYIFLSDQDDVWMDTKVSKTLELLKNNDFVVSDALFVDTDLNNLNYTYFGIRGGKNGFFQNLYKSQYLGACMAFKREILPRILPFPVKKELCPHDMWISFIAQFYYKATVIKEPLIKYRRHEKNVSTGGKSSENSVFKKLEIRFYCFFQVISRFRISS
ncbi:glycosyltransferase [Flavobacterium sp. B183]|uniref:glycosyltransferase n=1 Tax=Flavobacterium sp. B183 TaxID=907046 RepID=UPI00201EC605|nr:glycosyltransferase [Flavobacterium sp. B183]URC13102.1 glycosyltransferase [Flavobacterium sp. B183]